VTTTYTVIGTDATGCSSTSAYTVTVNSALSVATTATPSQICSGANSQLNAAVTTLDPSLLPLGTGNYTFVPATGTYTQVSGAATALPTVLADSGISTAQNIGFTFNFAGTNYTQFRMSSNGFISLNTSALTLTANDFAAANATSRPIIAPLWDDLDGRATGGSVAAYELTGTAPNRVLTVEWRNWEWNFGSTAPVISFEAKLYESSNLIEFVYRSESGSVNSGSASIGIGAPTGTGYINLTSVSSPAVSSTTSVTNLNTKPATGTVYRFVPTAQTYTYSWSPSTFIEGQTTLANPVATAVTSNVTYTVTVTSSTGCSTTGSTTVSVVSGASITTQPAALTKCQGDTATFTVAATGAGLTYQWRKDGVAITGNASATTATLTITSLVPANSGSYDVIVTPTCGPAATSDAVALLVNPTPTAIAPSAHVYCQGDVASAIVLSGTPSGVTYDITGGAGVGLPNQAGVTSVPSFTAVAGSATITITPKANGCTGTAVTYAVTVNALPTALTVAPASAAICATASPVQLTASGGAASSPKFTELANTLPTTFTIANTTGTGSATLNTTYRSEGTGSVLFTTASTSADVQYAMNVNVNLAGANSAQLTFSHIAALEGPTNSYDIGYVEYSTNGGSTWTTFPSSSYAGAGTLITTQGTSTPVSGVIFSTKSYADWTTQFSSSSSTPGTGPATALWKNEVVNIPASALTSTQFRVRFRFTNDSSVAYYGWLLDNIKVTSVTPVAPTWSPAAGLYTDAAGVTAYVGGTQAATVYARPASTATYIARATSQAGCFTDSNAVTIDVSPATVGGSVAGGTTIASGSASGLLTLSGHVGNIVRWESSVSPFTTWTPIANTADTYTSGALTQTTQFRAVVQSGICNEVASSATTVTVNTITFGSATGAPACLNTQAAVTLNGLLANSTSSVGYTFNGVPQTPVSVTANASGVASFNVFVTAAGQTVVITSITRTDATPNSTINPTSNNSVTFAISTNCTVIQQCGMTLTAIDSYVYANLVSGAQGYRWKVTALTGPTAGQVQIATTALRNLRLTQLGTYAFATQYQVEVSVMKNSVWGPYGAQCNVSTPAATTQLSNCGQTLTSTSDVIYANLVSFAAGYRFRISDPANPLVFQVLDRSLREFRMNLVTSFSVQYGKSYNVEVAVKNTDGTYLPYGSVCTVTTPQFPTTSLEDAMCDDYAVPTMDAQIYAISHPGAIAYAFKLTGRVFRLAEPR
jgi:hypothetical protein